MVTEQSKIAVNKMYNDGGARLLLRDLQAPDVENHSDEQG